MTDKEKIRVEIERRLKGLSDGCVGQRFAYQTLLSFIDSMPEEPENDDLKEEIKNFLDQTGAPYYWAGEKEQLEWVEIIARHFANWQKKQLMKDGLDYRVQVNSMSERYIVIHNPIINDNTLNEGDHVKLIIIKDDQI